MIFAVPFPIISLKAFQVDVSLSPQIPEDSTVDYEA